MCKQSTGELIATARLHILTLAQELEKNGIFLVESLSVILQVEYFKLGKRRGVKQRLFKRTPIHDNFRVLPSQLDPSCRYLLKGWPKTPCHESKITVRFWIVTILLAAFTIITLKIR